MTTSQRANITALPIDDRPEVHRTGGVSGGTSPISLEQDKALREGERRVRLGGQSTKNEQNSGTTGPAPEDPCE